METNTNFIQRLFNKTKHNIGYQPSGTSVLTMISLFLKTRTLAQFIASHPAGG